MLLTTLITLTLITGTTSDGLGTGNESELSPGYVDETMTLNPRGHQVLQVYFIDAEEAVLKIDTSRGVQAFVRDEEGRFIETYSDPRDPSVLSFRASARSRYDIIFRNLSFRPAKVDVRIFNNVITRHWGTR